MQNRVQLSTFFLSCRNGLPTQFNPCNHCLKTLRVRQILPQTRPGSAAQFATVKSGESIATAGVVLSLKGRTGNGSADRAKLTVKQTG